MNEYYIISISEVEISKVRLSEVQIKTVALEMGFWKGVIIDGYRRERRSTRGPLIEQDTDIEAMYVFQLNLSSSFPGSKRNIGELSLRLPNRFSTRA